MFSQKGHYCLWVPQVDKINPDQPPFVAAKVYVFDNSRGP